MCCSRRRVPIWWREVLPSSTVARPHLPCCIQLWGPLLTKVVDLFGTGSEEATKMTRGLEHVSDEDRLREYRLLRLEKRVFWADLRAHSST